MCRIRAGNLRESINRGRLFGHDPIGAETGETAAQSFESRDRGGHAPPPRFGGESDTVCDPRMGKRSQQLVVLHGIRPDDRPRHLVRGEEFGRSRDVAEQIELLHLAGRIGKIPEPRYAITLCTGRRHLLPALTLGAAGRVGRVPRLARAEELGLRPPGISECI